MIDYEELQMLPLDLLNIMLDCAENAEYVDLCFSDVCIIGHSRNTDIRHLADIHQYGMIMAAMLGTGHYCSIPEYPALDALSKAIMCRDKSGSYFSFMIENSRDEHKQYAIDCLLDAIAEVEAYMDDELDGTVVRHKQTQEVT